MASIDVAPIESRPAAIKQGQESTAQWYKDAIIYQLHVRAFHDGNGDGIGDFRGLTEKLDYIQDLGVTAIWLLPFFPSPLKDDGYDIADYANVNPQYGTLADFNAFLEEARRRDLRVITELVMNHTSDQHAWFQRSRRAPAGSPWRDWYVWSDTPERYKEARIIFQDFESSNWSWDPLAGAYYWHRFYSHQPDLNFENPEVRRAMFDALDFWLKMGVDGVRLDAVPYLYESEGTNCENLPDTHAFLRDLRTHIDSTYTDKMLLAEANQWPEDAAAYFGDGDECHMNFHFPLMPRLFMAVEREDRSPIIDILEQTPQLPQGCQWAIFLRNHDELTLEMVTDEERDYMYRTYAVDAKARINLGIRRRLAPLLKNNRRKIELMNGLLLSLPGTPIIYYGDEIGMGDNFYLGDRNGVRTPMHWNADRNAGFSRANPQSLYLPTIIDPEYHYEQSNVDVQHSTPHSLLWWTRRVLDLRKQYQAFGRGSFQALPTSNSKVFAFLRETEEETLLVVANLSRLSQYSQLDLSAFHGRTPVELFGRTPFPAIGEEPYVLTMGPHGFFWFCLSCDGEQTAPSPPDELPRCRTRGRFEDLLTGRGRKALREALRPFLRRHRWFAGKARTLQDVNIIDSFTLRDGSQEASLDLLLLRASFSEGEPDAYVLPVTILGADAAEDLLSDHPRAGIMQLELFDSDQSLMLCEAAWDDRFWHDVLAAIGQTGRITGAQGALSGIRTESFRRLLGDEPVAASPHVHGGEQSNTSAMFDQQVILKLFRRVSAGVNPDFEIGRELTEHQRVTHVPQVAGALEYRSDSGEQMTVAILQEFVENVGDAWTTTLDELGRYFERVMSRAPENDAAVEPINLSLTSVTEPAEAGAQLPESSLEAPEGEPPAIVQEMIGGFLYWAGLLGRRTAELHVALADIPENTAFASEPFSRLYQRALYQSMRSQARNTIDLLRNQYNRLDDRAQSLTDELFAREDRIYECFGQLLRDRIDARRIRCHGDYHLGQVLFTGKDFVIIDFEGEPDRPVSERRIKASPLRDVAGMLRSLHYASHAALQGQAPTMVAGAHALPIETWASFWCSWTSDEFLRSYLKVASPGGFLPGDPQQLQTLLTAYLLEKALYELRYELNNRPDWVKLPLEGILQLLK